MMSCVWGLRMAAMVLELSGLVLATNVVKDFPSYLREVSERLPQP